MPSAHTPKIIAIVDGCAPEALPAPTTHARFLGSGVEVTSGPSAELERALAELAERAARSVEIWVDGRLAYEISLAPREDSDG